MENKNKLLRFLLGLKFGIMLSLLLIECSDPKNSPSPDKTVISCSSDTEVKALIISFYQSLELTKLENEEAYLADEPPFFDLTDFNELIENQAIYSSKRVENLSNEYHYLTNIYLVKILEITNKEGYAEVKTLVDYEISEMGTFQNIELIKINFNSCKISEWKDIELNSMDLAPYEGMESFTEEDFYDWIGSNKDDEDL